MLRAPLLSVLALVACQNAESQPAQPAAAAAPVAQGVKATPGPRAQGKGYLVEVVAPKEGSVGSESTVRVVLTGRDGYHVNKEFPTALTVTPPEGVTLKKAQQTGADAKKLEEAQAVFEVPFTAATAGKKNFQANFRFAVCTETTCDPKVEKLAWEVAVK